MTRAEELDLIADAIASGKLKRPTQAEIDAHNENREANRHHLHKARMDSITAARRSKSSHQRDREVHYRAAGIL